ncbi:C2H2-type zinc finger protein [Xenorhabdus khoisanae]|uniref:C2H2-type zinc finger protein n=1 Tax=Xenorhabdus khoisanae TaxID=880157 RepID=UPI003D6EA2F9
MSNICPVCNESFTYYAQLQKHLREHHKEYKPHSCHTGNCSQAFLTAYDLHIRN